MRRLLSATGSGQYHVAARNKITTNRYASEKRPRPPRSPARHTLKRTISARKKYQFDEPGQESSSKQAEQDGHDPDAPKILSMGGRIPSPDAGKCRDGRADDPDCRPSYSAPTHETWQSARSPRSRPCATLCSTRGSTGGTLGPVNQFTNENPGCMGPTGARSIGSHWGGLPSPGCGRRFGPQMPPNLRKVEHEATGAMPGCMV